MALCSVLSVLDRYVAWQYWPLFNGLIQGAKKHCKNRFYLAFRITKRYYQFIGFEQAPLVYEEPQRQLRFFLFGLLKSLRSSFLVNIDSEQRPRFGLLDTHYNTPCNCPQGYTQVAHLHKKQV